MAVRLSPSELVTVLGVGHTPLLTEPEALAGIGRLLDRVAGRGALSNPAAPSRRRPGSSWVSAADPIPSCRNWTRPSPGAVLGQGLTIATTLGCSGKDECWAARVVFNFPDAHNPAGMARPLHILHLHSSFSLGGKEARAVALMNAFGDAAKHTIVSGLPDELGEGRDAIARGIRYEIAQDAPSLTGKASVKRYEAIAAHMRRFDLVLTYNWGAIDGVMARRVYAKGAPPLVHHEDGFNADEARAEAGAQHLSPHRPVGGGCWRCPGRVLEDCAHHLETARRAVHRIPNGIDTARYARDPEPGRSPASSASPRRWSSVRWRACASSRTCPCWSARWAASPGASGW
jgi:hypothetical protein